MHISLSLISAAEIGRFDEFSLADQARLEMLVMDILENPKINALQPPFFNKNGDFESVCAWSGVECDRDMYVTEMTWESAPWLRGTRKFSLTHLPPKLDKLYLSGNALAGTVDWNHLQACLRVFYISNNCLTGGVNLQLLPPALEYLNLSANKFSGCLDFSALPANLVYLELADNDFRGAVCMKHGLPKSLSWIDLTRNRFDKIDRSSLPPCVMV